MLRRQEHNRSTNQPGQRSRAIQLMMTAPLITSLPVHTQHLMTAQLTLQWTPLPLRYHLTTYTYKNTFIIINNNKTYLILQTKTRPHTPSRAITSFSQQEHQAFSQQEHSAFSQEEHQPSLLTAGALSFLTARAPSLLTAGAPSKPSHSRSTQPFHSTSTKPPYSRRAESHHRRSTTMPSVFRHLRTSGYQRVLDKVADFRGCFVVH